MVKFFAKNEHKKENSLGLFFIKLLESCFVGVMTGWLCKANDLSDNYTYSVIGLAGYCGVEVLEWARSSIIERIKQKYPYTNNESAPKIKKNKKSKKSKRKNKR